MTLEQFRASLASDAPPPELPALLQALWHDGRDEWQAAHRIAQDVRSPAAAWVHAYLHRKEGDSSNAAYWYGVAKQPVATGSLFDEWTAIVQTLLNRM